MLLIVPAFKKVYPISECLTEVDIQYGSLYDASTHGYSTSFESCRSFCNSKGENFFNYVHVFMGTTNCYCLNSNADRRQMDGHLGYVSGEASCSTSRGKLTSKKREMDCWLKTNFLPVAKQNSTPF